MKHDPSKIDFFNRHAALWDRISPPPTAQRLRQIIALTGSVSSVLDVGCGTGVLTPLLLERIGDKGRLYALDPAEEMLKVLTSRYSDPRIATCCDTLEDCDLPENHLDAIICFSSFPHLSDKPKAMRNAQRMLKPGGAFVIAHVSSRDEINAFHRHSSEPVRDDILPDERAMRRLLSHAGFEILRCVDEPGRYEVLAIRNTDDRR